MSSTASAHIVFGTTFSKVGDSLPRGFEGLNEGKTFEELLAARIGVVYRPDEESFDEYLSRGQAALAAYPFTVMEYGYPAAGHEYLGWAVFLRQPQLQAEAPALKGIQLEALKVDPMEAAKLKIFCAELGLEEPSWQLLAAYG